MIFNCFSSLQEDILASMNTYTHFGKLALDNATETPFQKLIFLIRDWNNPGEYTYGSIGGKKFLEDKLKVKAGQTPEAKEVRKTIRNCFKEIDCFIMPQIGEKALYPGFIGSVGELAPNFAKKMEEFISKIINSEALVIKEILGAVVTGAELKPYLDNYLQVFNSSEIPSATSMWEATSDVHNTHILRKACDKFTDLVKQKMMGNICHPAEELEKALTAGEKQAIDLFKKARKFGTPEKITEYEEELERCLNQEKKKFERRNEEKRSNYLNGAISDASSHFRSLLEENINFDVKDPTIFYEDKEINRAVDEAKAIVIEELKEKLGNETEAIIKIKIQTLESILESSILSFINKNKAQRAEAVKKVMTISAEHQVRFEDMLKAFLKENEFVECQKLQTFQNDIVKSFVTSWKKAKKPGKKVFQQEFLSKFEKELSSISSRHENEHKFKLGQFKTVAENRVQEICQDYEEQLTEQAEVIEMEEELEMVHQRLSVAILKKFCQNGNPYPAEHSLHAVVNQKLKDLLAATYEIVKREVVQLQQRSEESYREAVQEALRFYDEEMNDILRSCTFLSEEDLQVENQRVMKEALQVFEGYEKVGTPDNALDFKVEVQEALRKRLDAIMVSKKQKRKLAHSLAKYIVNDCHESYLNVMMLRLDTVRTVDQLEGWHKQALREAKDKFYQECPANEDQDFVKNYEGELEKAILDAYEELKEMKRNEEVVLTKALLGDCRKYYRDEMQKHCETTLFIQPDQLDACHQQAKTVVMEKLVKMSALSVFQKMDLETEMNTLFIKYSNTNDMKLNFAAGLPPAIGIDSGTNYCCVTVYINGEVKIIPNMEQRNIETTASYVTFNADGSIETYGNSAKENAYKNPENTIYDVKKILGRKIDDPDLQRHMKFWPFEVKDCGGIPVISINGKLYFPEQVSAKLFNKLRIMADRYLGLEPGTIRRAVITVPAYFNDDQRRATKVAGELAGLKVLALINEHTAAAVAYTHQSFDSSAKKVLIFSLGRETFDVAVLDVSPGNIDVLGVDGDTQLGGEDFDRKMMEYCALKFKDEEGIDLWDKRDSSVKQERHDARVGWKRLQSYCETAKKNLATASITTVSIDAMYDGLDLMVEVTREQFEEMNGPMFRTTIDIVERVLRD